MSKRKIIMADDTEREFDRVEVKGQLAHCYEKMNDRGWMDRVLLGTHKRVTTIPVNRIKEIQ